jgi:hypothetical protein
VMSLLDALIWEVCFALAGITKNEYSILEGNTRFHCEGQTGRRRVAF